MFLCYLKWTMGPISVIWINASVNSLHAVMSYADFVFKINFFQVILSGTISEYQSVWNLIRTYVLIWAQTVCKGFQQTK